MNGPLKFLTARKILPLLDLLAKFKRVLSCSCSPNFCVTRKLAKQIFISARARKKIAVLGMLANSRKDHSVPLHEGANHGAETVCCYTRVPHLHSVCTILHQIKFSPCKFVVNLILSYNDKSKHFQWRVKNCSDVEYNHTIILSQNLELRIEKK